VNVAVWVVSFSNQVKLGIGGLYIIHSESCGSDGEMGRGSHMSSARRRLAGSLYGTDWVCLGYVLDVMFREVLLQCESGVWRGAARHGDLRGQPPIHANSQSVQNACSMTRCVFNSYDSF
jgi:hypothetical protein